MWRRALIVPHLLRLRGRAPRGTTPSWERFWATVTATGDGGDVLWDSGDEQEARRYRELLDAHADRTLPLVDVGCGNGRFTRALAAGFPSATGVDVAPAALARARLETAGAATPPIAFRTLDITRPGAGRLLRDELGTDVHVFVRGVLHVLDAAGRREAAAGIAALAGERGVVLLAETDHRGSRLGYLERLGAGPRGLPPALAAVVGSGLAAPLPFGRPELDDCFPQERWRRIVSDPGATITTVPPRGAGEPVRLPGFVALLAARPAPPV